MFTRSSQYNESKKDATSNKRRRDEPKLGGKRALRGTHRKI